MAPGGSNIFVCGTSLGTSFHSKHWFSLDPCGIAGALCSWFIHVYAFMVISFHLISHSTIAILIYLFLYMPAAALAMFSLYKAWTTDPGAVPLGARPLTIVRRASTDSLGSSNSNDQQRQHRDKQQRALRRCHKCNDNYKPPRAHHDSVTGRCIVKFDHFCPWVGNSIGALNHKYFCLFLFYTMIACVLSLLLLFIRAIHCGYTVHPDYADQPRGEEGAEAAAAGGGGRDRTMAETTYKYPDCRQFYNSTVVLGLFICSLIFLFFTCSMGCEQIEAVETGQGKIARMKLRVGQAGTEMSRVTEEFNEMFGGDSPHVAWHWFSPAVGPIYPRGMKKVVLGYEWDESFDPEPYEPTARCMGSNSGTTSSPPHSPGGALGDHELQELEQGTLRSSAIAPPSTSMPLPPQDVLLLDDRSVHSEASASLKNRRLSPSVPSGSSNNTLKPID